MIKQRSIFDFIEVNLRDEPGKRELSRLSVLSGHRHYFEGSDHPVTKSGEKDFVSSYKNLVEGDHIPFSF